MPLATSSKWACPTATADSAAIDEIYSCSNGTGHAEAPGVIGSLEGRRAKNGEGDGEISAAAFASPRLARIQFILLLRFNHEIGRHIDLLAV